MNRKRHAVPFYQQNLASEDFSEQGPLGSSSVATPENDIYAIIQHVAIGTTASGVPYYPFQQIQFKDLGQYAVDDYGLASTNGWTPPTTCNLTGYVHDLAKRQFLAVGQIIKIRPMYNFTDVDGNQAWECGDSITPSVELRGLTFTSDTASQSDSDPGAGKFKWNDATQSAATKLYFNDNTADSVDVSAFWAAIPPAGFLYLQQSDDPSRWQEWKYTAVTDGTGYRKLDIDNPAKGISTNSIQNTKIVYTIFSTGGFKARNDSDTIHTSSELIFPDTALTDNMDGTASVNSTDKTHVGLINLDTVIPQVLGDGDKIFSDALTINNDEGFGTKLTVKDVAGEAGLKVEIDVDGLAAQVTVSDGAVAAGEANGFLRVYGGGSFYGEIASNGADLTTNPSIAMTGGTNLNSYGNDFGGSVMAASNASPIEITTGFAHGRTTGDSVTIAGVTGNTAANGTWTITVTGATTFTLDGSTGSGAYVSGGTWGAFSSANLIAASGGPNVAATETVSVIFDVHRGRTIFGVTGISAPNSLLSVVQSSGGGYTIQDGKTGSIHVDSQFIGGLFTTEGTIAFGDLASQNASDVLDQGTW